MKYVRWFISGVALFFLAGCFQVTTVVRVNPDGSGTVEESMLLSKKIIAQMDEIMRGGAGDGGAEPKPVELFDPAKLKEQARAMGEGVTYRSGEKVVTADYTGYTATFAFTDINELRLNLQSGAAGQGIGGGKETAPPIIFHFTKGPPATLTVEQPRGKPAPAAPETDMAVSLAASGGMPDEESRKFAEMLTGMKFQLAIEVNGTIVATNATHREGKRITLVELDLAKLGAAAPQLEKLSRLNGGSLAQAKELLKDFPGMKVDMNDRLNVVFRK
jgi:hypothetical protein